MWVMGFANHNDAANGVIHLAFRRRPHPVFALLGFLLGATTALLGHAELQNAPGLIGFSWSSVPPVSATKGRGPNSHSATIVSDKERTIQNLSTSRYQRALSLNCRGLDVLLVQKRLAKLGYFHGVTNGYFDEATHRAIAAFQETMGLMVDGRVGPETYVALGI